MAVVASRIESKDHRTNALLRGVVVIALAIFYVVRLWGRPVDGVDLFFGAIILVLAGIAALYGVSHVRKVPGGIEVWNGARRRRLSADEVDDTAVMTLGSRRARPDGPVDWRTAAAPSYLAVVLRDGERVVAYGIALEPSLRRRSAGPQGFLDTVNDLRSHLGLPLATP